MRPSIAALLLAGAALPAAAATPLPQGAPVAQLVRAIDIPYTRFMLANGLEVIVHTDRKAPVVALAVWYHVGSKYEPAGRTGFAHLFEHLMFGGSENSDRSWFEPMQAIGATNLNGTTSFDRTNYFETVPRGALDTALFLESDRMGHLLGAVTQAKLDTQRGVVQNEKRQRDTAPGGMIQYEIFQTLFPQGHPYHHTPIGSMADLDTAGLADVKGWFREHYGPNNATLVLSGDIAADEARPLVERYFGDIARGPETARPAVTVPTLPAPVVKAFTDQVANVSISRVWAVPGVTAADTPALEMAASVLGGLASSRLDNALVRGAKLAVAVSASSSALQDVGLFSVDATVKPGVDPAVVGRALDAAVAEFLRTGPTAAELERARTQDVAAGIRTLESVSGAAATLAQGAVYAGDPGFYRRELAAQAALTPAAVQAAARKWLSRPAFAYTLSPGPRGAYEEAATVAPKPNVNPPQAAPAQAGGNGNPPAKAGTIDRSPLPAVGTIASLAFPRIERATLSNGIPVTFARRDAVPVVQVSLRFDAGNAADPKAKLGTQSFMLALMAEGSERYTSIEIAQAKENLGANIAGGASMDRTGITLSALAPNLAPSIDLLAEIVRRPRFAPAEIERLRATQLARIAAETSDPGSLALRTLPPLLYGAAHPYGVPFTGTGDAAAVATVTRDDLIALHDRWLRPDNLKIFVVGDTTLAQILPLLEKSFGDWRGIGPKPVKDFSAATPAAIGRIVLIDRPAAPQSLIFAGQLLPVSGTDDILALEQASDILGGSFLSRLNVDLRETKHWAYGVSGSPSRVEHRMPYLVYAPVQADRTGGAIDAIRHDIGAYLAAQGTTPAELTRTIDGSVRGLAGLFGTSGGVLGGMLANDLYRRPDDYYQTLPARLRALTAPDLDRAARAAIDPAKLVWVVIGDKAKVMPQLTPLGLPVEVMGGSAK